MSFTYIKGGPEILSLKLAPVSFNTISFKSLFSSIFLPSVVALSSTVSRKELIMRSEVSFFDPYFLQVMLSDFLIWCNRCLHWKCPFTSPNNSLHLRFNKLVLSSFWLSVPMYINLSYILSPRHLCTEVRLWLRKSLLKRYVSVLQQTVIVPLSGLHCMPLHLHFSQIFNYLYTTHTAQLWVFCHTSFSWWKLHTILLAKRSTRILACPPWVRQGLTSVLHISQILAWPVDLTIATFLK